MAQSKKRESDKKEPRGPERLEETWMNPLAHGPNEEPTKYEHQELSKWIPLPQDYPDWKPLDESWQMDKRLEKQRAEQNISKPLSEKCVETIARLWDGETQSAPCKREHHGSVGGNQHFHCYPISRKGKGKIVWAGWTQHQNIWWCSSLKNAANHYSWPGNFEPLAAALQSAMRRGDQVLAAAVCLKILDWGGVRYRSADTIHWLGQAILGGTLIQDLSAATALLCPQSTGNLNRSFGTPYPRYPMNSGSTKIFAAVAMDFTSGYQNPRQDIVIYDGRVSTALGLLARRVSCPQPVSTQFQFPYDDAHRHRGKRNPSCVHTRFPRMTNQTDWQRADYARLASRCIQQCLGAYAPSADFIMAEKALFMIGADVRNMCCKCLRTCP